jgi:hypothetical protein
MMPLESPTRQFLESFSRICLLVKFAESTQGVAASATL